MNANANKTQLDKLKHTNSESNSSKSTTSSASNLNANKSNLKLYNEFNKLNKNQNKLTKFNKQPILGIRNLDHSNEYQQFNRTFNLNPKTSMIKIEKDQENFMDSYGRLIVDNKFQ